MEEHEELKLCLLQIIVVSGVELNRRFLGSHFGGGVESVAGFGGGKSLWQIGFWASNQLGRSVWRLWVAVIQIAMGGWIDAATTVLISFNRRLVVVGLGSWFLGHFLGLWFSGYVNFVEIFGFLGGCLLVVSRFVVSRCLFVVRRECKYCWNF